MILDTPDLDYPYHYELRFPDRVPMDVWLRDKFITKAKCKTCSKVIYRAKTRNDKSIPLSIIKDPDGYDEVVPHWERCKR